MAAYEEVQRMLNALVTSLRQSYRAKHAHAAGRLLVSVLVFCQMFTSHWSPVTGHSSLAYAQVPNLVRYQGQAVDANSVPLAGPYNLTFRLYNAETAGAIVWQETQANVAITKGNFSILLGQVTPLTVDWSVPLWLSIQVGIESELSPRQRITSVPLAIRAETAESLVGGGTDTSARVYNSANISIANATETYLTFNSERWDTDTIHSTSSNTDRLTATTAGKYFIFVQINWATNSTGRRKVYLEVNGSTIIAMHIQVGTVGYETFQNLATHYNLAAGDYVKTKVYQDSGGALNCESNSPFTLEFGMVKVQ
jgi:hypothetical protein